MAFGARPIWGEFQLKPYSNNWSWASDLTHQGYFLSCKMRLALVTSQHFLKIKCVPYPSRASPIEEGIHEIDTPDFFFLGFAMPETSSVLFS